MKPLIEPGPPETLQKLKQQLKPTWGSIPLLLLLPYTLEGPTPYSQQQHPKQLQKRSLVAPILPVILPRETGAVKQATETAHSLLPAPNHLDCRSNCRGIRCLKAQLQKLYQPGKLSWVPIRDWIQLSDESPMLQNPAGGSKTD